MKSDTNKNASMSVRVQGTNFLCKRGLNTKKKQHRLQKTINAKYLAIY